MLLICRYNTYILLLTIVFSQIIINNVVESFQHRRIPSCSMQKHYLKSSIKSQTHLFSTAESEGTSSACRIKVIGVGGGGGNAVNRMVESSLGVSGVELWALNTDSQALSRSSAPNTLKIGAKTAKGLGAGGTPNVGAAAAEESREDIANIVKNTDLVFVTAGMGGGTGSGAAPIVAECAKQAGALTIGVVTKPFNFEGRRRMDQAKKAIAQMKDKVDTLIVVSNDKLLQIVPENTPLTDAFLVADDILRQGVIGISDIIIKPGLINVDFADVRTIMTNAGTALMGIGHGKGKTRAVDAAIAAISSPLLDFPITNAKGIVFNIVGGPDMSLQEINSAAEVIYENVDENANIIFGALVDDKITNGEMSITVLATGFPTDFFHKDGEIKDNGTASARPSPSSSMPPSSLPPSSMPSSSSSSSRPATITPVVGSSYSSSSSSSATRRSMATIDTIFEDEEVDTSGSLASVSKSEMLDDEEDEGNRREAFRMKYKGIRGFFKRLLQ